MKSFALALLVASTSAAWAGTSEKAAQAACDTWKAANSDKKAGDADYDTQCVTNVANGKKLDESACAAFTLVNTDSSTDAYKAVCPEGATNVTAFAATMAAAIAALAF